LNQIGSQVDWDWNEGGQHTVISRDALYETLRCRKLAQGDTEMVGVVQRLRVESDDQFQGPVLVELVVRTFIKSLWNGCRSFNRGNPSCRAYISDQLVRKRFVDVHQPI
jgi:hypothetical protein